MIVEPKVPADGEVQTGRHCRTQLVSPVSYYPVSYYPVEQPAMNVARRYRYRWR
jgi:hypothetical protein